MNRPFDYLPYRKPDADNTGDVSDDENTDVNPEDDQSQGKGGDNKPNITDSKAYKTLQTKYNLIYNKNVELEKEVKDLGEKVAQLELTIESKDREIGTMKKATDTNDGKIGELTKAIEDKDGEIKRLKLIMNEFPELAEFEDTGVLPKGNDVEELKKQMKLFSEKIQRLAGKKFDRDMEGLDATDDAGSGTSDGDNQQASYEDIYEQGAKLAGSFNASDQDKFQKLENTLIEQEKARRKK